MKDHILRRRDAKTKPHLAQFAPVWLLDETVIPEDEAVLFTVMFQHNEYGWVTRRYRYDSFNNVLYYKGQNTLPEEDALAHIDAEPFVPATVSDIPNAYGG